MKNRFTIRLLIPIIIIPFIFVISCINIKSIGFIDLISIIGLENCLISLVILILTKSYPLKINKYPGNRFIHSIKYSFKYILEREIILLILIFSVYTFKAYFISRELKQFFYLVFILIINNYIIIIFHQVVILYSPKEKLIRNLTNTFIIITTSIILSNLPVFHESGSLKSVLYYFPLPGAFLVPINPDLNISVFLIVPFGILFLPFIFFLRNEMTTERTDL